MKYNKMKNKNRRKEDTTITFKFLSVVFLITVFWAISLTVQSSLAISKEYYRYNNQTNMIVNI